MTQINISLLLQDFFNKNPDIRESRNKGLINRRALAKYIIEKEKLSKNRFEALVTALRRFESTPTTKETLDITKEIKISTKDNISILYLEKSGEVLSNISKVINLINFNKNETLKIVHGSLSIKLFIDEFNIKKISDIFPSKDITKIYSNISEISILFPDKAKKTKGIVSYVTSQLTVNNIAIIELLTCTPELIIYTDEKDLLKSYETLRRLKNNSNQY